MLLYLYFHIVNKMLENIFIRRKPIEIFIKLLYLKPNKRYVSEIHRQTNCTYTHITKLLAKFEEVGLISHLKQGQKKVISLTPSGIILAKQLAELMNSIQQLDSKEQLNNY